MCACMHALVCIPLHRWMKASSGAVFSLKHLYSCAPGHNSHNAVQENACSTGEWERLLVRVHVPFCMSVPLNWAEEAVCT